MQPRRTLKTGTGRTYIDSHAARSTDRAGQHTRLPRDQMCEAECDAVPSRNRITQSTDGVPADCIRLSEAFRNFVLALYPESGGIENMHAAPLTNRPASEDQAVSREFYDVIRSADFEFRNWLAGGGPQAYVRDPRNGERLQLAKEGWIVPASQIYVALGFPDDFVWHDDSDPLSNPGITYGPANTLIDGSLMPVFFLRSDFDELIAEHTAATTLVRASGRPSIPSINLIKSELDRWIAGGKAIIVEKLKTYRQGNNSIAAIARALGACARTTNSEVPTDRTIENKLREKLRKAFDLL